MYAPWGAGGAERHWEKEKPAGRGYGRVTSVRTGLSRQGPPADLAGLIVFFPQQPSGVCMLLRT